MKILGAETRASCGFQVPVKIEFSNFTARIQSFILSPNKKSG
jgi:hypothetical protein